MNKEFKEKDLDAYFEKSEKETHKMINQCFKHTEGYFKFDPDNPEIKKAYVAGIDFTLSILQGLEVELNTKQQVKLLLLNKVSSDILHDEK